jgi:hypothetical protein
MNKWFDAKEKPPEHNGRYLAYYGTIFFARYNKSTNTWEREGTYTDLNQFVTHWMLPPKPTNDIY